MKNNRTYKIAVSKELLSECSVLFIRGKRLYAQLAGNNPAGIGIEVGSIREEVRFTENCVEACYIITCDDGWYDHLRKQIVGY
jgi:hypothetical protein